MEKIIEIITKAYNDIWAFVLKILVGVGLDVNLDNVPEGLVPPQA